MPTDYFYCKTFNLYNKATGFSAILPDTEVIKIPSVGSSLAIWGIFAKIVAGFLSFSVLSPEQALMLIQMTQ
ncbi:hypothetical protein CWB99_18535 [Pseudoalteromonas rubra]|uniref:Uncharacterized protein n=1 Tax=Pseudoalteromonas rubra TaxID=43658 RepID=A0A5S3WH84_9GAMM|nr:hypothetical protein CWB99_18535 [Pseudoalteromonas rubra]TMP32868.1 hypothetical protein CWC00_11890 [Pseudoalteromonas rubra]